MKFTLSWDAFDVNLHKMGSVVQKPLLQRQESKRPLVHREGHGRVSGNQHLSGMIREFLVGIWIIYG